MPLSAGLRICPGCGQRLQWQAQAGRPVPPQPTAPGPVATRPVASAQGHPHPIVHGAFWRRVGAFLIDLLILLPAVWVSQSVLPLAGGVLVWWLYFALFESSPWQGTPGKRLLRLKVTDANGVHLRFGRASLRFVAKLLSAAPAFLGFALAAWTPNKQALHDLIASTLVITKP